ncbi:MAG: dTDP-4-dehydrorhamnose 3,5-epimerase [Hoeflea sp.]|uniref:dTDP-4-dehydrorhamnose 3,5-epimerase n=1 Tax=Hoeflea sp. TaxID=1940281 RepID=UPI0032EC3A56
MIYSALSIDGAYRIDPERIGDDRGSFARTFCAEDFAAHGLAAHWAQMNVSFSASQGTVRGMHFQRPPTAEAKLVRCLHGAMFDVLVDLRRGSPSFGQWTAVELTPDTGAMVYVPEGVAHGFQTLKPDTEVLYCHSVAYDRSLEGGLRHDDPTVGISWPLPVSTLSARDRTHPGLNELEPITP